MCEKKMRIKGYGAHLCARMLPLDPKSVLFLCVSVLVMYVFVCMSVYAALQVCGEECVLRVVGVLRGGGVVCRCVYECVCV